MKRPEQTLILVALLLSAFSVQAQDRNSISLGWGSPTPAGGGNFLNRTSWIDPSLDWEYHLLPWLSAGISVGYGYACEKGMTHDRVEEATVDGYSERTLQTIPVQVRLRYFPLGRQSMFRPLVYASGGAQCAWFDITGDAINSAGTRNWAGMFSAGVGVRYYPVFKGPFMELSGGWQYAGNKFEMMNTRSQRGVELRLGVGFSM